MWSATENKTVKRLYIIVLGAYNTAGMIKAKQNCFYICLSGTTSQTVYIRIRAQPYRIYTALQAKGVL